MGLLISKELDKELQMTAQQLRETAAAAETLLRHLDEDRAKLMLKADRIAKAAQEPT